MTHRSLPTAHRLLTTAHCPRLLTADRRRPTCWRITCDPIAPFPAPKNCPRRVRDRLAGDRSGLQLVGYGGQPDAHPELCGGALRRDDGALRCRRINGRRINGRRINCGAVRCRRINGRRINGRRINCGAVRCRADRDAAGLGRRCGGGGRAGRGSRGRSGAAGRSQRNRGRAHRHLHTSGLHRGGERRVPVSRLQVRRADRCGAESTCAAATCRDRGHRQRRPGLPRLSPVSRRPGPGEEFRGAQQPQPEPGRGTPGRPGSWSEPQSPRVRRRSTRRPCRIAWPGWPANPGSCCRRRRSVA